MYKSAFVLLVLVFAGPGASRAAGVSYNDDVRPILSAKCFKCHGFDPETRRAGLRLDTREGALANASGDAAVVPGHPDSSPLLERVLTTDPDDRMPPKGEPLTATEVDILRRWIEQGANYEPHWAYAPVKKPAPPRVARSGWVRNPIDNFILSRLEAEGIAPSAVAPPAMLIRRVYLDLTGLPPPIEAVEAFEARPTAANYERIVRKLLRSPAFGEHWGRWWLDLARYADSTGYQHDFRRVTWPYRDWVIKALNADMPFDRFTIEQVAGDLLPNPTRDQRVATGFYRVGSVNLSGGAKPEEIQWMMAKDRVNTTGTVWMASTLECAQCHTHKYDPFTQKEYYQLAAYFRAGAEEAIPLEHRGGLKRMYGATLILDGYPKKDLSDNVLHARARDVSKRLLETKVISDQIVQGRRERMADEPDYVQLALDIRNKEAQPLVELYDRTTPYRMWVMQDTDRPRPCHLLKRGDYLSPGEEVSPATPEVLHELKKGKKPNRLELARWLVSRDNPLTARVMVNRWWNEIFGRGIVTTTEDFGYQSALPSHPKLLDWLASDLMDNGWSMKRALYKMVTSATYMQSSDRGADPAPEHLFAYGPRFRLTAEAVRDTLLAISGLLVNELGGEPVCPPQPEGLWREIQQVLDPEYPTSTGRDVYRRSVYVVWRRGSLFPAFATFDAPVRTASITKRVRTNTPLQALTLMNEPVFLDAASAFAKLIQSQPGDANAKLTWAFRRSVARAPTDDERQVLSDLLESSSPEDAWFAVAHTLLNLDETIVKR